MLVILENFKIFSWIEWMKIKIGMCIGGKYIYLVDEKDDEEEDLFGFGREDVEEGYVDVVE